MTVVYTGGCACSRLRYRVAGEPVAMLDCQCRQCQRESGTGHQSHLVFQAADVEQTGNATEWDLTGDGGTVKRRAFCSVCGSPVSMTFPSMPDSPLQTDDDHPDCRGPAMGCKKSRNDCVFRHADAGLTPTEFVMQGCLRNCVSGYIGMRQHA